ncbi:MAG: hypothetical protein OCD76_23230 [Reichenbachiella sp.]
MKSLTLFITLLLLAQANNLLLAQDKNAKPELVLPSKNKIKFFASAQMWLRHTDLNPGSTIQGTSKNYVTDISIRRFRMGAAGYVTDNLYVKFQLGLNNLNPLASSSDLRILDIEAFYTVNKYFTVGGGKTGYVGLSRYAGPASGATLGFDLPFFAMTTVGITDDILRRPSLAIKGDLGKLNYLVVAAKQLKNTRYAALSEDATFQPMTFQEPQFSAYLKYQFFDKDKNTSAFLAGTYLGTRKILNVGVGFEYQKNALKGLQGTDTVGYDIMHFAADVFLDMPLDASNKKSVTFYGGYFNYNFGDNYIRNVGVNGTADGVVNGSFNGAGNAFPANGTGEIYYTQGGFRQVINEKGHAIMPYASMQLAVFDKLDDSMIMYDLGFSYLFNGHKNKLTLGVQNRPIFDSNSNSEIKSVDRKNMYVLQYQIKI